MKKLAERLTNYVQTKNMIKAEERKMYTYGFQVALETAVCIIISAVIACTLRAIVEGILFFIFFIPLRSYAGGLHMEHYTSCLLLSCSVYFGCLVLCKELSLSLWVCSISITVAMFIIWKIKSVENKNRKVDEIENQYFSKCLKRTLLIVVIVEITFMLLGWNKYLCLEMLVLDCVAISMLIEKIKNC